MKNLTKEDYKLPTAPEKSPVSDIDKILHQIQTAYKTNIQAQQLYLDIVKRKNKNITINSNFIKSIYALFTQNKANQICFQKEEEYFCTSADIDERLIRRYYARLIEIGIRKISFFWMNAGLLDFLVSCMGKLMTNIHACFTDLSRVKNLDLHFVILKLLFLENQIIQEKIYQLLIDQGYIFSMDQFYRINGVDLVADKLYERKKSIQSPSVEDSDQQSFMKKDSLMSFKISKQKLFPKQRQKKIWSGSKTVSQPLSQSIPIHTQSKKTKIKTMLQSIVTVLKSSLNQKSLQPIQQQPYPKSQLDNILTEPQQEPPRQSTSTQNLNKTRKRLSKAENIVPIQMKRRVYEKKLSIQLMSYFSNQFKSVIGEVDQVDIDCLSEVFMRSESNSKSIPTAIIKMNNSPQSPYIHSLKSLQSIKRIRQQKKRGKFMQIAIKNKNIESLSQLYEQISQQCPFRTSSLKNKFSFRSAPGVYITLPKKRESNLKPTISNTLKLKNKKIAAKIQEGPIYSYNNNKFVVRQNFGQDQIFQNQLIVNQLVTHKLAVGTNMGMLNCTNVNGDSLFRGIIGSKQNYNVSIRLNTSPQSNEKDRNFNIEGHNPLINFWNSQHRQLQTKTANQYISKTNTMRNFKIKSHNIASKKLKIGVKQNINEQNKQQDNNSGCKIQLHADKLGEQAKTSTNKLCYTVYDRLRRKIILQR